MWAARVGKTEAATIFLDNNAEADAVNEFGATAMHEAVDGNHVDVVQALVERRANPNIQDGRGNTPLMLAARSGHAEVIRALMDGPMKVELEVQNNAGQTALTWAVVNGHIKVVRLLMSLGSDPMTLDADGRGILAITASTGQENLMKAMLESILSADQENPAQVAQALSKAALMFSQQDNAGNTCLMAAARHSGVRGGDPAEAEADAMDCCKVVMQHESGVATIDMVNNEGDTALIGAVRENRAKVCEYLLEHGADRSIANKWNMDAEFLACVPLHPTGYPVGLTAPCCILVPALTSCCTSQARDGPRGMRSAMLRISALEACATGRKLCQWGITQGQCIG